MMLLSASTGSSLMVARDSFISGIERRTASSLPDLSFLLPRLFGEPEDLTKASDCKTFAVETGGFTTHSYALPD